MSNTEYLEFAKQTASDTGQILLKYFGNSPDARSKSSNDLVTQADLEVEQFIIHQIKTNFPEHKIYSEETIRDDFDHHDPVWVIDPLDGTNNFFFGLPYFCTSIALMQGGKTQVGVVYAPLFECMFSASLGRGARKNDEELVSHPDEQNRIFLIAETGYNELEKAQQMFRLVHDLLPTTSRSRALGALALDIAFTAQIKGGCCIASGFHPWDVAAASLIAEEAGALATDFAGQELNFAAKTCIIAHPQVHKTVQQAITDIRRN